MGFFFVLFASWALLALLIPYLRKLLVDYPKQRSSHLIPTPTGGGIVFVLITSCVSAFYGLWTPLLILPLSLIGLFDDLLNLSVGLRYGTQLLTAIILITYSPLTNLAISNNGFLISTILILFLLFIVTGLINSINFMDGMDGLIAANMIIIFSIISIGTNSNFSVLLASLLGFLLWNWSPAKVFMGDVGSLFLGAFYAGTVLNSQDWIEAVSLLLLSMPLIADTFICFLRRLLARQSIFKPHSLHLYQRIHQSGWKHAYVSLLYSSLTGLIGAAYLFGGLKWILFACIFILIIGIYFDQVVAVSFREASLLSNRRDN